MTVRRGAALSNGEGGEGIVYEVEGQPDLLMKLYTSVPSARRRARLVRVIEGRPTAALSHAAWPLRVIEIDGQMGVLLPRVLDSRPIHQLYDVADRRQFFPGVHWGLLVAVAADVARACAAVHAAGFIVVDVSDSNVLVKQPSLHVTLIDCDSFVPQDDSVTGLGTAMWLAPELLGRTDRMPRTPDHDNFAIARLIFLLLFQGSNPLDVPAGQHPDSTSERVFAFGRRHPVRPAHPNELTLEAVTPEVAELFEAAFVPPGHSSASRPSAQTWAAALERMGQELVSCHRVASHWHLRGQLCPWCAMAARNPQFDPFAAGASAVTAPPRWLRRHWFGVGTAIAAGIVLMLMLSSHSPVPTSPAPLARPAPFEMPRAALRSGVPAATRPPVRAPALPLAPQPPPPVTLSQSTEQRVADFVIRNSNAINGSDDTAYRQFDEAYAPVAVFYGHVRDHVFIMREKAAFLARWPVRNYHIRPGTISIQCTTAARCEASMITDFDVSHPQRESSGAWLTRYTIDASHAWPVIIMEDGNAVR